QEPLDLRRQCLSHCLSLLMPAFALLKPPPSLTSTASQAKRTLRYHSEDRRQTTDDRCPACAITRPCGPEHAACGRSFDIRLATASIWPRRCTRDRVHNPPKLASHRSNRSPFAESV